MTQTKALATAILVCSAPLLGCGPAPYLDPHSAPRVPAAPAAPTQQAQAVIVVLQEPPAEPPVDAWLPEDTHGENPLGRVRAWHGDYDCPQGNTDFTLHILATRGDHITAMFDFHHVESGASGRYLMSGRYHSATRAVRLTPGAWLDQPPHYESVAMRGEVSEDGSLFAGKKEHPLCGAFRLRPAR